jgi:hypothetical protein
MLEPVYNQDADSALRVKCLKVLFLLDQTQYECDHLEEAGKAKGAGGGCTTAKVQMNVERSIEENKRAAAIVRGMMVEGVGSGGLSPAEPQKIEAESVLNELSRPSEHEQLRR